MDEPKMNRDDIIRMAREAGLGFLLQDNWAYHEQVECFFHMAVAAEREACVVAGFNACVDPNESVRVREAIRARGQT